MTWLTCMEYLCHKWSRIGATCRKHFPVLSSFTTYYRICNYINTTGATSGAGTAYPSGAPQSIPGFSGVRVTRSLDLYVCFVDRCFSFCTFFFAIVLSVLLRYMISDCSFGIFKLFFWRFAYLFKHFIQSSNFKLRLRARHFYNASQ